MKLVKIITVLTTSVILAGCMARHLASSNSSYAGDSFGNYKCYATGGSHTATGWASNRSDAEANALDKCREHAGTSCSITSCTDEGSSK